MAGTVLAVWIGWAAPSYACPGDCDGDGQVTVDEILVGVAMALGQQPIEACPTLDGDASGSVTVDELLAGVRAILFGCPAPTVSPTPTATATPSPSPPPATLFIEAPEHGAFTTAPTVEVAGFVDFTAPAQVLRINGMAADVAADGRFAVIAAVDTDRVFNGLTIDVVEPDGRLSARERIVVVAGDALLPEQYAENGLLARINDSGFDRIAGLLADDVPFDIETILAPGTVLVSRFCALDSVFGCIQRVDVVARSASIDDFGILLDANPGFLAAQLDLDGIHVVVNIRGGVIDCDVAVGAQRARISGDYVLFPDVEVPARIGVVQLGDADVAFTGFAREFTSGICDFPVLGDLIALLAGDLEPRLRQGLVDFLRDPDGEGPEDAAVAAALKDALGDFNAGAAIGDLFGSTLEAPFADILSDADGITFVSDTRLLAEASSGESPALGASLRVEAAAPPLGATVGSSGLPYDVGFALAPSAFNQLLRGATAAGVLDTTLTEVDLGLGPVPLTPEFFSLIVPEFRSLAPTRPLALRLRATLAPVVTGRPGPRGAAFEMRIAHIELDIIAAETGDPEVFLGVALDAVLGLSIAAQGSEIALSLAAPEPGDVTVTLLRNAIGARPEAIEATLPLVVAQLFPLLADAFGGFSLPELAGLQAQGVAAGRADRYLAVGFEFAPGIAGNERLLPLDE